MSKDKTSSGSDTIQVQNLSLPKGGGAISSISEKISVQDFTGSSSYSLPVPVSSCRSITPTLTVGYSSGSGNSEFGLGWNLALNKITRKTSKGIPKYNEQDTFLLGSEDLVPITDVVRSAVVNEVQYKIANYYLRHEGSFSLIEYWQAADGSNSFWQVTNRDHSISLFGVTDQAKLYDPANKTHIFTWYLEEAYNTVGDHQLWFYKREDGIGVSPNIYEQNRTKNSNLYLERVRYGHDALPTNISTESLILSDNPLVSEASGWHFEIVFNYGEYDLTVHKNLYNPVKQWQSRPDPFSFYSSGFEIRNYRLCQNSLMFHRFIELGDDPVLVSVMNYNYQVNSAGISELVSSYGTNYLLDTTTNTYKTASTPGIKFSYIEFTPLAGQFEPITEDDGSNLTALNETINYRLVDLFGEGVPGILYNDANTDYYRRPNFLTVQDYNASKVVAPLYKDDLSGQRLTYGPWETLSSFPVEREIEKNDTVLTDITGNGQPDVVQDNQALRGFWQANANETWNNFQSFQSFPTDSQDPGQNWIDITGNGLNDLVQIRFDLVRTYPSARGRGLAKPIVIYKNTEQETDSAKNPADLPVLASSARRIVTFAEIDGSGRQHLVEIEALPSGKLSICYWPNLGYGHFGAKITMGNLPNIDFTSFDSKYLFIADIDGTGTADLIYMNADSCTVYTNNSGNSFANPITIDFPTTLRFDNTMQVAFADLTGRGTTCLIISDPKNTAARHFYYDFCQGEKPYLLKTSDNNMGAITTIEYASSIDFYLKDRQAGTPWLTPLPFPVLVVKNVISSDLISKTNYTSLYAYHHGYFDGDEREFRGFGRIDRQDTEYFSSGDNYTAPSLTRTWYHTGYESVIGISTLYAHEYYQGDNQEFAFEDSTIDLDSSINTEAGHQAYTALAGSVLRSELYGLTGGAAMASPYSTTENNYHLRLRQDLTPNKYNVNYAVFTLEPRSTITYTYECNSLDPRISQQFTIVDDYSNPTHTCAIAYPRREGVDQTIHREQQQIKATASLTDYIKPDITPTDYLIGVAYESKSFDITTVLPAFTDTAFRFADIQLLLSSLDTSASTAPLLSWNRMYYADPTESATNQVLPLAQIRLPVLIAQQAGMTFAGEDLSKLVTDTLNLEQVQDLLKQGYYQDDDYGNRWSIGMQPVYQSGNFYLPTQTLDPAGNATTYDYDIYNLLLTKTTDALNNRIQVQNIDYRLLQAQTLIDINGNISQVAHDILGRVIYTSFSGQENGQAKGFASIDQAPIVEANNIKDILANPTIFIGDMASFFYYDLFAWQQRGEPACALSITADNYPGAVTNMHLSIGYSDGFGRNLQVKAKVEEGLAWSYDGTSVTEVDSVERWVTTGAVVYDNKGQTIKAYEPYYSDTANFVSPDAILAKLIDVDSRFAITPIIYYDPLGRVTHTITAKGLINRQTWTPWQHNTYDANDAFDINTPYYLDNIANGATMPDPYGRYYDSSLPASARQNLATMQAYFGITAFVDTPNTIILDNLGSTIVSQRIRTGQELDKEVLSTYYTYDIKGNLLTTADPRLSTSDINNFTNTYGFANQIIKVESADAGTKYILNNVFGNPIYISDARGIVTTSTYDKLQRLVSTTVVKASTTEDPLELNQIVNYFIYGDTPDAINNPEIYNLRGQVYMHYDQAGLITVPSYALTGGVLSSSRQFLTNYTQVANWNDLVAEAQNLQTQIYSNSSSYDAFGRITQATDVDGNQTIPSYNLTGQLQSMQAITQTDGQITKQIQDIIYDAKGQRQRITYGNATSTSYTYDPKTWAVTRIYTVNDSSGSLQDINYIYDPVGNIINKTDHAQDVVFYDNQQVLPAGVYTYDSLYQVIIAQGRQHIGSSQQHNNINKDKKQKKNQEYYKVYHAPNNLQALEQYIENYTYDSGGNLTIMQHQAASGSWTTNMTVSNTTNRAILSNLAPTPVDVEQYFDPCGNQLKLKSAQPLVWNEHNNISQAVLVERDSGNDDAEYYVYDSAGQRVRKVSVAYASSEQIINTTETIYLGEIEIKRISRQSANNDAPTTIEEYHTLDSGVANYRYWFKGNPPSGIANPSLLYKLTDHLGSVTIDVDVQGKVVTVEEYTPYGASSLFLGQGSTMQLKVKRYSGKERDATGFYYYGARYYSTVSGRWMSPDPIGPVDGPNIYLFLNGNPVNGVDLNGNNIFRTLMEKLGLLKRSEPSPNANKTYYVNEKEYGITRGNKIATSGIQQCVALVIHDSKNNLAAMLHINYGTGEEQLQEDIKENILPRFSNTPNVYLYTSTVSTEDNVNMQKSNITKTVPYLLALREKGKINQIETNQEMMRKIEEMGLQHDSISVREDLPEEGEMIVFNPKTGVFNNWEQKDDIDSSYEEDNKIAEAYKAYSQRKEKGAGGNLQAYHLEGVMSIEEIEKVLGSNIIKRQEFIKQNKYEEDAGGKPTGYLHKVFDLTDKNTTEYEVPQHRTRKATSNNCCTRK